MTLDFLLFSAVILIFITAANIVQGKAREDKTNSIVPIATVNFTYSRNKTRAGRKRICETDNDCKDFSNNKCCLTLSGYSRCRKKCKITKTSSIRKRGRKKFDVRKTTSDVSGKYCNINGKFYEEGYEIDSGNPCKKCSCSKGVLNCSERPCYAEPTSSGQPCYHKGKVFKDRELMKADDDCNKCVCIKGTRICTEKKCPPPKCTYKGKKYDDSSRLVLNNGCKRCICQKKTWICSVHPCKEFRVDNSTNNAKVSFLSKFLAIFSMFYSFYSIKCL